MKKHDHVTITLLETNGSVPSVRPAAFTGELLMDVIVGRPIMAIERPPGQNMLRTSRVVESAQNIVGRLVKTANSSYLIVPCPN